MEDEDGQSVSKNEIDSSKTPDPSTDNKSLQNSIVNRYDALKLKTSLLKLKNSGMPEESDGLEDSKDNQESSPSGEKKVNGELLESENCVSKENGANTEAEAEEEMAPLSLDVEEAVDEKKGPPLKQAEPVLKRKLDSQCNFQESSSSDEDSHSSSPVEFRGFKKRMIAKAEKSLQRQRQISESKNCSLYSADSTADKSPPPPVENTKVLRSSKAKLGASDKEKSSENQLTEYAQYLGLQPTVKFKCYRCGEKNFQSMGSLNAHQTKCSKSSGPPGENVATKPALSTQVDSNPSTNFRITRKVYLCSACGTYYENWKLFLHMRDVHKRHICLFCLGMFAVAEKLAEHLFLKHNVIDNKCKSPEEFLNIFKGSCYLTCCTCEKMFTERENFYDHQCKDSTVTSSASCLSLRDSTQQTSCSDQRNVDVSNHSQPSSVICSPSILINQSSSSAASSSKAYPKRLKSVPTLVRDEWAGKPSTPSLPRTPTSPFVSGLASSDSEYIDASNFCHVDIDEARSESPRKTYLPNKISLKNIYANLPTISLDSDSTDESDKIECVNSVVDSKEQPANSPDSRSASKETPETEKDVAQCVESKNSETLENSSETDTVCRDVEDKSGSPVGETKTDEEICTADVEKSKQSPAASENEEQKSNLDPTAETITEQDVDVPDVLHSSPENDKNISDEKEEEQTKECSNESETCKNDDDDDSTTKEVADKSESTSKENCSNEDVVNLSEDNETSENPSEISTISKINEEKHSPSEEEKMDTESNDNEGESKKTPVPLEMEIERSSDDEKSEEVNFNQVTTAPDADISDVSHSSSDNDEISFDKKEEELQTKECINKPDTCENDSDPTKVDDADKDNSSSVECGKITSKSSESGSLENIAQSEDTGLEDKISDKQEPDPVQMDANDEPLGESKENGVSDSIHHPSENNIVYSNEDNKSDGSDDSDKLSVVVSEASLHDENSLSENNDEENQIDSKSNNDNAVHSDCDSQAHTNQSEEILNGKDDDSEALNPSSEKIDSVVGIKDNTFRIGGESFQLASEEVMAMALTLEDKMESLSAQSVIKECIRTSCTTCGYCSHAVKIGVNGKQLALHLLAEHRYKPVKNETVEDVIERLKKALDELQDVWFNTDSYDSSDKSCFVPFDHTYECFQCNFVTKLLKDLYVHKRKVHQKTILYCSMCKANFYSYSELLCHMCPGVYVSKDIQFRCCFCEMDRIPSAFRLMVHLRKSHHTCDICLELAGDQQKLSTHMWKHKLHHLCYRCGIAYRNKPDITKHLFWKHGTESVLCKKCLQKKWPHVYHFCIPPTVFICEECNISFSRAVALKVHKRIHAGDYPYACSQCSQKFVSRKILTKHETIHNEATVNEENKNDEVPAVTENSDKYEDRMETDNQQNENKECEQVKTVDQESVAAKKPEHSEEHMSKSHKKKNKKDKDKKNKPVVDVYDLPPLNLSSESDDSDDEKKPSKSVNDNSASTSVPSPSVSLPVESISEPTLKVCDVADDEADQKEETGSNVDNGNPTEPLESSTTGNEDNLQAAPIIDGIWDNFHSYKAEQEKRESSDPNCKPARLPYPLSAMPDSVSNCIILGDHDYCFVEKKDQTQNEKSKTDLLLSKPVPREHSSSIDHDYCTSNNNSNKGSSLNVSENGMSVSQRFQESKSPGTTPKKKQKSPKKSEKHNSSSSSDSSSDSDSSSCSNSNCSCCSSGSGSSSSSSSDSDSSSSEGKQRQGVVSKRERKREKTRTKKKEAAASEEVPLVTPLDEEPIVDLQVEAEEPPIKESDLDTDESSTDEDFYDQYPQRHANQMLAEKRNQLMVLATVAPVNNGISSPPPAQVVAEDTPPTPVSAPPVLQSASPPPVAADETPAPPSRPSQKMKRVRAKKRRKGGQKLQTNPTTIPAPVVYEAQPSTSFSQPSGGRNITSQTQYSTPSTGLASNQNSTPTSKRKEFAESDSTKRLSKRRRVPNKFYGYSSDEEEEEHQQQQQQQLQQQLQRPAPSPAVAKWRKVEQPPPPPAVAAVASPQPDYSGYLPKVGRPSLKSYQEEPTRYTEAVTAAAVAPTKRPSAPVAVVSSSAGGSSSSSSSSGGSDSDSEPDPIAPPPAVVVNPTSEKDEKLYCYCQCPYDEVSEMIACDGADCTIEWFHFECVGIMVPPKGKWYCPDCKRRKNLL